MIKSLQDTVPLNNSVKMPGLGFGVFKVEDGAQVINAVKDALKAGYKSIDTAAVYGNEEGVGKAIKEGGVDRKELFITTKVWNADQGYDTTLKAFDTSMKKLGLDYLDLYLIHWPGKNKYKDTWKALEKLYKDGHIRAIGVSNFQPHHLDDLLETAEVVPAVNQIEYHPWLTQAEALKYCKSKGIFVEAWSPLAKGGDLFNEEVLKSIAKKYGKTPAQVVLRWDIQNEVITIPKSVHNDRIIENTKVFDFSLTAEEMAGIEGLNRNKRTGPDPDVFVW